MMPKMRSISTLQAPAVKGVAARVKKLPGGGYSFVLPLPPSANDYWNAIPWTNPNSGKLVARNVPSKLAREYKAMAASVASAAGVRPLEGNLRLTLVVHMGAGDLSNRVKVLEDSLIGVAYADDKQNKELHVYHVSNRTNPKVEVTVEPIAKPKNQEEQLKTNEKR